MFFFHWRIANLQVTKGHQLSRWKAIDALAQAQLREVAIGCDFRLEKKKQRRLVVVWNIVHFDSYL